VSAPTGFVGLSHLGVVASAGWASKGGPVVAVDTDPALIEGLRRQQAPVFEPGLDALLAAHRDRLTYTTDFAALAACPVVILSRDVPTTDDNTSDLSVVEALIARTIPHLRTGATLVVMNQVPPGFTRSLDDRIRRERPEAEIQVLYWVETLVLGQAVERYVRPERIILGCPDASSPIPAALAAGLATFACPVLPMRYESAELAKTAINLYLSTGVTYANTLADLCERIGADWTEMMPALRLDARIGPAAYIRPSLGITGGNLERDLVSLRRLARGHGVDASLIETILDYNERRWRWVTEALDRHLFKATARPTIGLWGLAYKKNTTSLKNAVSLRLIDAVADRALIQAYDPAVKSLDRPIKLVATASDAAASADCLVITADWDEFATADLGVLASLLRRPLVIDCVGILAGRRSELPGGVTYVAMGRAA
jgi:UDPglucose 6-dehydrogenase